ncbi:MAG: LTA synthase family protein [Lachnospiraceae bacterium]|nr:LTA synthase family protein [Lachnospiraceae bacterium]
MEVVFGLLVFQKVTSGMLWGLFAAASLGFLLSGLTNLGRTRVRRIVGWVCQSLLCLFYGVQYIYYKIFKTFLSYSIVVHGGGGEALSEFTGTIFDAIYRNIFGVLLLLLPLLAYGIYLHMERVIRTGMFHRKTPAWTGVFFVSALVLYLLMLCLLPLSGKSDYSAWYLYHSEWVKDLSFEKLGFLISTRLDLASLAGGSSSGDVESDAVNLADLTPGSSDDTEDGTSSGEDGSTSSDGEDATGENGTEACTEETTSEEETTTEAEEVKYNVLDIDFEAYAESESDSDVKWLHEYMASSTPTKQNEYTGLFEGYNLILICAESFSPWAVDEEVTPTLYKLVNTGFVFENFYNPGFNNTSDGEYMLCTGLLPNGQGSGTFQSTVKNGTAADGKNDMALCFGNLLGKLGYLTLAYHNHTYSYYKHDLTHPNMGYVYKGLGNGLDVTATWPESDLEMMQLTLSEYIDEEPFHAYYMTVSGHMNYTWIGNSMSSKNKSYVEDLDLSESLKAYLAAQKELDLALEYVLETLEEAGELDHTVIALAADHYPYALEEELTAEIGDEVNWYGLYKSNLILWSASMEEPVYVTKACSSIDIAPTLCNLMGIEYDSRLYTGNDILSDEPGLVIFSDKGFATDYCIYNTSTGQYKALNGAEITEEYLESVKEIVKQRWKSAGLIVTTDYYSYLAELD